MPPYRCTRHHRGGDVGRIEWHHLWEDEKNETNKERKKETKKERNEQQQRTTNKQTNKQKKKTKGFVWRMEGNGFLVVNIVVVVVVVVVIEISLCVRVWTTKRDEEEREGSDQNMTHTSEDMQNFCGGTHTHTHKHTHTLKLTHLECYRTPTTSTRRHKLHKSFEAMRGWIVGGVHDKLNKSHRRSFHRLCSKKSIIGWGRV